MHQQTPKQEVKTLSIRIPLELYLVVSQYALDKELPSLNAAIIDLITAGIDVTKEKDTIISQFIMEFIPLEQLEKLIDGK